MRRLSCVDDFYAPEVNSKLIPLPGVRTATGKEDTAVLPGLRFSER